MHTSPICLTVVFTDREYTRYSDYRQDIDDDKHTDKYPGMKPTAAMPVPNAASCLNQCDDMDKTVLLRSWNKNSNHTKANKTYGSNHD